jgi:hypothetical protein
MPAHDMKVCVCVCVGVEVQLHSFLTSTINGTNRQPNASVTLIREGMGTSSDR